MTEPMDMATAIYCIERASAVAGGLRLGEVVEFLRAGDVAQGAKEPALVGLLTEVDPGLAEVLRENGGYVQVIRRNVIEECAKVLDGAAQDWHRIRDPGMANNAKSYAKQIRALALPSTHGEGGK